MPILRTLITRAYLGDERHDQGGAQKHQCHDRRCNECLRAMCIEVLGPQWCPPRVGRPLLVVDIEGVCGCSQNGNAEDNDESSDDGLSQVEGRWVDLHLAFFAANV